MRCSQTSNIFSFLINSPYCYDLRRFLKWSFIIVKTFFKGSASEIIPLAEILPLTSAYMSPLPGSLPCLFCSTSNFYKPLPWHFPKHYACTGSCLMVSSSVVSLLLDWADLSCDPLKETGLLCVSPSEKPRRSLLLSPSHTGETGSKLPLLSTRERPTPWEGFSGAAQTCRFP